MSKIQYIGYVANIVTCVSLLLYIVGKLISGIIAKRYNNELFVWNPNEEILKNYYVIHKEEGDAPYEDNVDKLMIASENCLVNVKAYRVTYDRDKFIKNDEIFSYDRLSPKECIMVSSVIPEGIPNILIEWETPTYMEASIAISYDGKIGNIFENITYKHTFKSIMFYLFNK